MGWKGAMPDERQGLIVLVAPSKDTVEQLLNYRTEDSYHLFSGIRGFSAIFAVFRQSLKYQLHRGIIVEGPFTFAYGRANGKPLWLHWLRYQLQDAAYIKQIDSVFAIGDKAQKFFKSLNQRWNVYPFSYCTKSIDIPMVAQEGPLKVCFVGSLSVRKNVMMLLRALNSRQLTSENIQLTLYGDGPERKSLEAYTAQHHLQNVTFAGTQQNADVPYRLAQQDVLVLPSIHDGWGAVVNEALQQGCYVVCTNTCGAASLLTDPSRGCVVRNGDSTDLARRLQQCVADIDQLRAGRAARKQWAENHIDGRTIAHYMVDCLSTGKQDTVPVPWK
jgi:glycosyltransferase involved in cell wall biosynthesis